MKLYIVKDRYYGTQQEAKDAAKEAEVKFLPDTDTEEVPTDKAGLIAYLNVLMCESESRLDSVVNADRECAEAAAQHEARPFDAPAAIASAPSYAEQSANIDDIFGRLPMAHQLTLTQLAHENAIAEIGRLTATVAALSPKSAGTAQPPVDEDADLPSATDLARLDAEALEDFI